MIRRRFVITGRVQGVGYRFWTQHTADQLGLSGWVRNLPDGSVEAEVSGPTEAVDELERACHDGPPAAGVDAVHSEEIEHRAGDGRFEIR
ncbi:acylphosphatase [Helcobacillus massiliensis]|uniref:acylphosphatase n=1 Tax=Helcobacillus massiliensis TaxID=521392 RepID=UPI002553AB1F|nr:acylphosphatase [Helcobacillus massiliensis]MDK7741751.1 acylphosphatase [Helcobacillus massiliensis]WOO92153.1 acylphosphatase [Helcobacillus massiliensis]